MKNQIDNIRQSLLTELKDNWPNEQIYINCFIPFVNGIKYLYPNFGEIGYYEGRIGKLDPFSIEEFPIESLLSLRDSLIEYNKNHENSN